MSTCQYWLGSVDLMVQTTYSLDMPLYSVLFLSVALYWPGNIGKFLLVNNETLPRAVQAKVQQEYASASAHAVRIADAWGWSLDQRAGIVQMQIIAETEPPEALRQKPFYAKQLHTLMLDRHSTADYIALLDSDSFFVEPVTPHLLFAPSSKPWMIGSSNSLSVRAGQLLGFLASTRRIVAPNAQTTAQSQQLRNFMMQQPVVVQRSLLLKMRDELARMHGQDFVALFAKLFAAGSSVEDTPCNFCILGNWALLHYPDSAFEFVFEGQSAPVLRVAMHHLPFLVNDVIHAKRHGNKSASKYLQSVVEKKLEKLENYHGVNTKKPQQMKTAKPFLHLRWQTLLDSICSFHTKDDTPLHLCKSWLCKHNPSRCSLQWHEHLLEFQHFNGWGESLQRFDVCRAFTQLHDCRHVRFNSSQHTRAFARHPLDRQALARNAAVSGWNCSMYSA